MRHVGGALALQGRKRKENIPARHILALTAAACCSVGFAIAKEPCHRPQPRPALKSTTLERGREFHLLQHCHHGPPVPDDCFTGNNTPANTRVLFRRLEHGRITPYPRFWLVAVSLGPTETANAHACMWPRAGSETRHGHTFRARDDPRTERRISLYPTASPAIYPSGCYATTNFLEGDVAARTSRACSRPLLDATLRDRDFSPWGESWLNARRGK
jgi:hypothetical protein